MNGPNPSKMIQSHGCRLNGEIPVSRYLNGCPFESLTSSYSRTDTYVRRFLMPATRINVEAAFRYRYKIYQLRQYTGVALQDTYMKEHPSEGR